MNIETSNVSTKKDVAANTNKITKQDSSVNFADELKTNATENNIEETVTETNATENSPSDKKVEKGEIKITQQENSSNSTEKKPAIEEALLITNGVKVEKNLQKKIINNKDTETIFENIDTNDENENLGINTLENSINSENKFAEKNVQKNIFSKENELVDLSNNKKNENTDSIDIEQNKNLDDALEGLNSLVKEFNQSDEKRTSQLKNETAIDDKKIIKETNIQLSTPKLDESIIKETNIQLSTPKLDENIIKETNIQLSTPKLDENIIKETNIQLSTPKLDENITIDTKEEKTQNLKEKFIDKKIEVNTSPKEILTSKKEDTTNIEEDMINNDFNIQENKEILPQMNPGMNFSGDGQPFSSFMNNDSEKKENNNNYLEATAQDLAEEAAILSTMAENIAIANKNQALKESQPAKKPVEAKVIEPKNNIFENKTNEIEEIVKPIETKVVTNNEGIKKVDVQTGITIDNIVKFDNVIMNQADVEVFTNLIENGSVDMNNLAPKAAEKAVNVSKTLADMLAKAMETNQPLRIDFDNDISVIIRISRDGKLTADFLPSSQVAEAYLKENLPILRQRFEDNNLDYESLNQRERREQHKENQRKKDRNNE